MLHKLALLVVEQTPNHVNPIEGPLTWTEKLNSLKEIGIGAQDYLVSTALSPVALKHAASRNYTPDATSTPTPTKPAEIPAVGPTLPTGVTAMSKNPFGLSAHRLPKPPKAPGISSKRPATKLATDDHLPLLAAIGGGVGGWALGSKIVSPLVEKKIEKITEELAKKEQTLGRWRSLQKSAPLGGAIAGALLLAALASWNMRRVARQARENAYPPRPLPPPYYDQSGGDFQPQDKIDFNLNVPRKFY